ncbi:DUF2878 domain-containing protein [Marinomonas posidonica]|uniref:DUF2878 domain-containing protein n=1 Tax=Marinomonas posidonica TaxID=936476 RepID=UPI00373524E9
MAKKAIINAVLFQTIWFVCLLMGSLWALLATMCYLAFHHLFIMKNRHEWRLICVFLLLGFVVDGSLFRLSVFTSTTASWTTFGVPPVWLICLWVSVATLFAHSLSFLRKRYALAAGLGLIGPTMSYFAGANMAGITLASPLIYSLLLVAALWAMILPFGVWLTDIWQLTDRKD